MQGEREVGGLRCGQVLDLLADYLEGAVSEAARRRIEAHLAGCSQCARFGGRYADVVASLREELRAPPPLDPAVARRLADRLEGALARAAEDPTRSDTDR